MSTVVRFLGLAGLALTVLLGVEGCGMAAAKAKAEAAMETFHEQLSAGDFDAIWRTTDDTFRNVTSRLDFEKVEAAVHRKLGRVVRTTDAGWRMQTFNFKSSIVLHQKTVFEHGSGTETFTLVINGDEVKLAGYYINSMELVTL
jgi:hypothetical protein